MKKRPTEDTLISNGVEFKKGDCVIIKYTERMLYDVCEIKEHSILIPGIIIGLSKKNDEIQFLTQNEKTGERCVTFIKPKDVTRIYTCARLTYTNALKRYLSNLRAAYRNRKMLLHAMNAEYNETKILWNA